MGARRHLRRPSTIRMSLPVASSHRRPLISQLLPIINGLGHSTRSRLTPIGINASSLINPPAPLLARRTPLGGAQDKGDPDVKLTHYNAPCRYMRETLRTTHLESLLMKHIEMSTEIKSLDSDMQMLVYENYNKFIYATETIRSMKSNVDGMDANMRELKQLIGVRPHLCSSFRFTF
jgi:Vps51/Vps67